MSKRYLYKVYNGETFLGVLAHTKNDFEISWDINSSGGQITIDLGDFEVKTQTDVIVGKLTQTDGHYVVTQDGGRILLAAPWSPESTVTDLANRVKVWAFDNDDPNYVNGKQLFDGVITSTQKNYSDSTTVLTAYSWGVQLDNYFVERLSQSDIVTNISSYDVVNDFYVTTSSAVMYFTMPFTLVTQTTVNAVKLCLLSLVTGGVVGGSAQVRVSICGGTALAPGAAVASMTTTITSTSDAFAAASYIFDAPVVLTPGTYIIYVEPLLGRVTTYFDDSTDPSGLAGLGISGSFNAFGEDIFYAISGVAVIGAAYSSMDPSNILKDILNNYMLRGGLIGYDGSSIDLTGRSINYTFKYNTVFEGVKKCLELAPSNWFWYLDVGTNLLHFHLKGGTADHIFIRGTHIGDMKMKRSLDNLKNKVLYTGGLVSSANIISIKQDQESIAKYGQWLALEADNRVTSQPTLDVLAQNLIDENKTPRYSTTVTIYAVKYDIDNIYPGDMVTFRNFDDESDGLILQVASIYKTPDKATLTLDTLPPQQSRNVEEIKRDLNAALTAQVPNQ